jgi:hypothetical protein
MRSLSVLIVLAGLLLPGFGLSAYGQARAQEQIPSPAADSPVNDAGSSDMSPSSDGFLENIFDDKLLIDGYSEKLLHSPKEMLLAMINDHSLYFYKKAAAVRVFREKFAARIVQRERLLIERMLLRQLERASSSFVQVEIMHSLVTMDRYRYFDAMVPALIQRLDHYDQAVNEMAEKALDAIIESGNQRTREARVVFNRLRKTFFLIRKKLKNIDPDDARLKRKIKILRWSIKVLGTEELKNLPKEVINMM